MRKDDRIVYPPEAGPQAQYQKVAVVRPEEPVTSNGPLRLGWVLILLGGLFWGALVWMYGSGTDWMEPIHVLEAAPSFCLPVLYGLGGLTVLTAVLAMARGSFLRAMFLLIAGPVMVALCLVSGTFLRVQFGKLILPGISPAAETAGAEEEIVLTKADGWEIKAQSVSLEGTQVKMKVKGKPSEIPLSALDEASQRKVKALQAARKK
jgi:hypothetical protein